MKITGWPFCGRCNKPVDKIIDPGTVFGAIIIEAICHGEAMQVEIPRSALLDAKSIDIGGTVFGPCNPPKSLL